MFVRKAMFALAALTAVATAALSPTSASAYFGCYHSGYSCYYGGYSGYHGYGWSHGGYGGFRGHDRRR